MSSPVIAITTYGKNEREDYPLPAAYVEAVRRAGGAALLIPLYDRRTTGLDGTGPGNTCAGAGDSNACYPQGSPGGSGGPRRHADRYAPSLRTVAWAPDGVPEAFEIDGNENLVAVQWHPELTAATDPTQRNLFDWLVEVSRRST